MRIGRADFQLRRVGLVAAVAIVLVGCGAADPPGGPTTAASASAAGTIIRTTAATVPSPDTHSPTQSPSNSLTPPPVPASSNTPSTTTTDKPAVSTTSSGAPPGRPPSPPSSPSQPPASRLPTSNSLSAVGATVSHNALCGGALMPYYWEIGDGAGLLAAGSVGKDTTGSSVTATTKLSIASASKWIYSAYVTQLRGGAGRLTPQDVDFLHFTSGYTNIEGPGSACPRTAAPDTVNQCLQRSNPQGASYAARNPADVGKFYYNGGHMENHAGQLTKLGNVDVNSLGTVMQALLGQGVTLSFTEPLLSGGIRTSAQDYALLLRYIINGSLAIRDGLGTHLVCTRSSATCNAVFSPIKEAWHYSVGHWVEDDPTSHGDGAFSSPGAFGFYPWIDSTRKYYGVISRSASGSLTGEQEGYASARCGRLLRRAFMTGMEQTGELPSN